MTLGENGFENHRRVIVTGVPFDRVFGPDLEMGDDRMGRAGASYQLTQLFGEEAARVSGICYEEDRNARIIITRRSEDPLGTDLRNKLEQWLGDDAQNAQFEFEN